MMVMNEYAEDDQSYVDDDYYSDEGEERDDDLDEVEYEHISHRGPDWALDVHVGLTRQELDALSAPLDPGAGAGFAGEHGQNGKKKNKKKKKKAASGNDVSALPPAPLAPVRPPVSAPGPPPNAGRTPAAGAVTNLSTPPGSVSVTSAHANAMPAPRAAAPAAANPPPSSRAAGKQPMNYAAQPAPAAPPQAAARTARAASKAPAAPGHAAYQHHPHHHPSSPSSNASAPHKPRPPAGHPAASKGGNNKIWNTSIAQDRERIKEFWLGLAEDERRSLVKLEKEAVLKKMKEQQKHSCSCAVCGRKRCVIPSHFVVAYTRALDSSFANYVGFLLLPLDLPSPTDRTPSISLSLLAMLRHRPTCRFIAPMLPPHPPADLALHLPAFKVGTRLKKSSRYCTMLITRS